MVQTRRRAFRSWPRNSGRWPRSRSTTRSGIEPCSATWRPRRSSRRARSRFGSAGTAGISWWELPPRKSAPSAPNLRLILKSMRRIIEYIRTRHGTLLHAAYLFRSLSHPSRQISSPRWRASLAALLFLSKAWVQISSVVEGWEWPRRLHVRAVCD